MVQIPTTTTTSVDEILANAGSAMPLIPDGVYKAVIVKSELKDTKSGGKYLELTNVITEGQHKNTEFVERLNIINSNATAVKIAYETLARIAKAVGMATIPGDSAQLHNKPFLLKTATEEAKPYTDKDGNEQPGKPKSVIDQRGYAALPAVGVPVSATPVVSQGAAAANFPWQA